MSGTDLPYVCPRCRSDVSFSRVTSHHNIDGEYQCDRCNQSYPVLLGIPDFRVAPDAWIDIEADRAKGLLLAQQTAGQSFEAMVRAYWAMTPETSAPRAERFIQHVLGAEQRSREWISHLALPITSSGEMRQNRVLDIGCGTADIAGALGMRAKVVGIDVAFRWLVIAKRRLSLLNLPAQLVCCNAEALPFASNSFQHALSLGTVEHVRDVTMMFSEAARVLARSGTLSARTSNRYSLLPEPHVGMFGIGWLPRNFANRIVHSRTGQSYAHHHLVGAMRLRRLLQAAGLSSINVHSAAVLPSDRNQFSNVLRGTAIPLYEAVQRTPLLSRALSLVAPQLDATAVKP